MNLRQHPETGTSSVFHCGDEITFTLETDLKKNGSGWIRTNIGRAEIRRQEVIDHTEKNKPILSHDWYDIEMTATSSGFTITLPLTEVGRFEAKTFFLPQDSTEPVWPEGDNIVIKVEPADTICANTIYNAFVRQFGPNMCDASEPFKQKTIKTLEKKDYSVIPPSGTFRNLVKELDFIIGKMGFKIIQLLPVFPVPTTYGRMGQFGSPFASLDFMDVDPSYAELDKKTTPMDQFRELADAIHFRDGKLLLDLPINHTGWGSRLQNDHPEWFVRGENHEFESPGAWGVTWEDLSELDYKNKDLWIYMAEVFLFWCRQGVDGFRCDAGYMVPHNAWQYITAKVRSQYPDTLFLLEGLGGPQEVTKRLLDTANLDWAYSELFQNYSRQEIENYLPYASRVSETKGLLVHFAETHDNNRLASVSKTYSRMRTALCALTSPCGGFGMANGVEWFADDKIYVHEAPSLSWGSEDNQVELITKINELLSEHPCFHHGSKIELVHSGDENAIAIKRTAKDASSSLTILANLEYDKPCVIEWKTDTPPCELIDLLTEETVIARSIENKAAMSLLPGQVMCLSEAAYIPDTSATTQQRLKSKMMEVRTFINPESDLNEPVQKMIDDPRQFCADVAGTDFAPVTGWSWPIDCRRDVMVPPGHLLYVTAPHPFRIKLAANGRVVRNEQGIANGNGSFFTFLRPPDSPSKYSLQMSVNTPESIQHAESSVIYLPEADNPSIKTSFSKKEIIENGIYVLLTNGRGAMTQARGIWGSIETQYDALLAANLAPDCPVDRTVMLTRCRAWLVCRGYSQEIDEDCLESIALNSDQCAEWRFDVPAGQGCTVPVNMTVSMLPGENAISMKIKRIDSEGQPVHIIIRPDIEARMNHEKTKAFQGPEKHWPTIVSPGKKAFTFSPRHDQQLIMKTSRGSYINEPEWQYMIAHPIDAQRGLGDCSDLFSPGYFEIPLEAGASATLTASVKPETGATESIQYDSETFSGLLKQAMMQFVVKRDQHQTVIAGYPWFLDWGRDTLICLRGMISAGLLEESSRILCQFAGFEENGTIPNMIHGNDASNRNTSDAPLWIFTACRDLYMKSRDILSLDAKGRSIKDVLLSIADNYIKGTPNGVKMDEESGLIFSPPHFTWMDTNHPACTPREGYPIEIQALWFAALRFLSEIDSDKRWSALAETVKKSIMELYPTDASYLADCLKCAPNVSAKDAIRDDSLRPNQLFAITLGAVDDENLCRGILHSCEELLIPGAIRSLADRKNDSPFPYQGVYGGDEDTSRKQAYHNGTAWTWPFPSYSEALVMSYGAQALPAARALLLSTEVLINRGCIGQIPEITDGDSPHSERGCGAQAWGVTELFRVARNLNLIPPDKG
ncbi:hypothetical protein BVX94_01705 [bacterium B17]|nr:hypothetical protein BVX94_01705 [bacterium B17]